MKKFTNEMLNKLHAANNSVKGTNEYTKYYMEYEIKSGRNWKFLSHSIPFQTGEFKTVKDRVYIMITSSVDGTPERYIVTDEVKDLLRI